MYGDRLRHQSERSSKKVYLAAGGEKDTRRLDSHIKAKLPYFMKAIGFERTIVVYRAAILDIESCKSLLCLSYIKQGHVRETITKPYFKHSVQMDTNQKMKAVLMLVVVLSVKVKDD